MSKESSIQIYITAGALGRHAGVYSNERCWAAHPTDDETAAFRAAMKFWFGKGANAAWTYKNVRRVTVTKNTDLTWQANLEPKPDTVSCTRCKRDGFTEAGLKRHRCKGRKAPK